MVDIDWELLKEKSDSLNKAEFILDFTLDLEESVKSYNNKVFVNSLETGNFDEYYNLSVDSQAIIDLEDKWINLDNELKNSTIPDVPPFDMSSAFRDPVSKNKFNVGGNGFVFSGDVDEYISNQVHPGFKDLTLESAYQIINDLDFEISNLVNNFNVRVKSGVDQNYLHSAGDEDSNYKRVAGILTAGGGYSGQNGHQPMVPQYFDFMKKANSAYAHAGYGEVKAEDNISLSEFGQEGYILPRGFNWEKSPLLSELWVPSFGFEGHPSMFKSVNFAEGGTSLINPINELGEWKVKYLDLVGNDFKIYNRGNDSGIFTYYKDNPKLFVGNSFPPIQHTGDVGQGEVFDFDRRDPAGMQSWWSSDTVGMDKRTAFEEQIALDYTKILWKIQQKHELLCVVEHSDYCNGTSQEFKGATAENIYEDPNFYSNPGLPANQMFSGGTVNTELLNELHYNARHSSTIPDSESKGYLQYKKDIITELASIEEDITIKGGDFQQLSSKAIYTNAGVKNSGIRHRDFDREAKQYAINEFKNYVGEQFPELNISEFDFSKPLLPQFKSQENYGLYSTQGGIMFIDQILNDPEALYSIFQTVVNK
jgi:hypothetical protein